jgi:hypothetical protein
VKPHFASLCLMKDFFEAVDRAFNTRGGSNPRTASSGTEDSSGTASIGTGEFSNDFLVRVASGTRASLPR